MILHTLSASPASAAYRDCLKLARPGDALVLMGDGVYCALAETSACAELQATALALYILDEDARIAGIADIPSGISRIDMDALVGLTEKFPRQQAWY